VNFNAKRTGPPETTFACMIYPPQLPINRGSYSPSIADLVAT
jgi:hypothetical protein